MTATPSYRFTDRRAGDLAVDGDPGALARRRAAIHPGRWTWLRQVHGSGVAVVTRPGEHAGTVADAAVTTAPGAVLAVQSADCAPVLLVAPGGIGVVHAGWRGLAAGVIGAAAGALAELGAPPHRAVIGPCIRRCCYEFGAADLDRVADRCGPAVRATTSWGTPALDLVAGIGAACEAAGIPPTLHTHTCTACGPDHWSHRARRDTARQALVAWLP